MAATAKEKGTSDDGILGIVLPNTIVDPLTFR
jgi:hypothetical protein